MRLRGRASTRRGFALALVVLMSGCADQPTSRQAQGEPRTAQGPEVNKGPDINKQDRSKLREGGELRVPIDSLPSNYNPKQVDGARVVTYQFADAILPSAFLDGADGLPKLNKDFFTSIELVSTKPQVVRYVIAANAVWSNGRPLTWLDLRGHWTALNSLDTRYEVTNHVGYRDVAKVERGASDKEALLTFDKPFSDWQGLFRPLVPTELTDSPEAFNKGWIDGPKVTSGPFTVANVDKTAKVVTLRRNDAWWGTRPMLDGVIFRVLDSAARAEELANGGIDLYPIGGDIDLFARAKGIPGVEVRQATERRAGQLTFNGSDGAPLSDERLRVAIAQAINPQEVTDVVVGPIVAGAKTMGHHIFPLNDAGYRDNSGVLPFDQKATRAALDAQGWVLDGDVRAKAGTRLSLRFVVQATPTGRAVGGVVAKQLAAVGVEAKVEAVPVDTFQSGFLRPGNFDIIHFDWTKFPYPIAFDRPVFEKPEGAKYGNNFGRVYIPEIDALYDRALAEFDQAQRIALANQIDELAWKYAHHLPLYSESGAYAVRSNLANYGARGLGAYGFAAAGFMK